MEFSLTSLKRRSKGLVLSLVAAAGLVTGAAWQGLAADDTAPIVQTIAAEAPQAPAGGRALIGGRDSYADIVKSVAPAVVTIHVESRARMRPTSAPGAPDDQDDLFRRFFGEDPFGQFGPRGPRMPQPQPFRRQGLGSGVIVTPDGYVLTNNHVVDGATTIDVELTDGREFTGKVIGTDELSDLALLKVDATNLPSLKLGDSDSVEVGDVVLAIGNPLGIGQTVTMGIISAKGRQSRLGGSEDYEDFLQTDAPINQGNSGGALVNLKGELIGINAQIASMTGGNIGIGFAIPANMARHVMEDLKTDGRVRRAQLGVTVQPMTSDLAASLDLKDVSGTIVSSVTPGSAADKAGIKQGDVIVSFAGRPVRDYNALRNRVAESTPGSKQEVVLIRDGKEQKLTITLDEREPVRARAATGSGDRDDASALGITVAPMTPELARRENLPPSTKGLIVENVDADGRAASAGIMPGDVIKQINRKTVETVEELRSAVRQTSDRPVLLLVNRDGRDLYLTVRPS
jgi:Do/DeqQ family serine protease